MNFPPAILYVIIMGVNGPVSQTATQYPSWGACRQAEYNLKRRVDQEVHNQQPLRRPGHDVNGHYLPPPPLQYPQQTTRLVTHCEQLR